MKSLKTGMRPHEEISTGRIPSLVDAWRMDWEGTRVRGTIRTAVLLWRPEVRSGGQGGEGGDVETWQEVRGTGKSWSWGQGDRVLFLALQLEGWAYHPVRWHLWRACSLRQGEVRGETRRRRLFKCWVWPVLETDRCMPGVGSQRKDPGCRYQNVKWLTCVCLRVEATESGMRRQQVSGPILAELWYVWLTCSKGSVKVCIITWRRKWGRNESRVDCTGIKLFSHLGKLLIPFKP